MPFILLGRGKPRRVQIGVVSADYFKVMGAKPLFGRTFRPGEDAPGAAPVLVLSYGFWKHWPSLPPDWPAFSPFP